MLASCLATWGISPGSVLVPFSITKFPTGKSIRVFSSCVQHGASYSEDKKIEPRVSLSLVLDRGPWVTLAAHVHSL